MLPDRLLARFGAAVLLLGSVVGTAAPAAAATITVNTTADELNTDGDCAMREAIQAANTNTTVDACSAGSGTDTIMLAAGTYTLAIAGAGEEANATGDLDIASSLTIQGTGAATTIVDGANLDRVFHVVSGTVTIDGLTVRNGMSDGGGGGILNVGTLTLGNAVVSANEIDDLPGETVGGGIYNAGSLEIAGSTVSGNSAGNMGGGIFNEAGATATLNDTTVSDNLTTREQATNGGGGIFNGSNIDAQGTVTVTHSTVSDNTSTLGGAGILNQGGILTVTESSVTGNVSTGWSGTAGDAGGIRSTGTATITDSTVSGNSTSGSGGGIINVGTMNLTGSTISGNSASSSSAGGIENGSFGVLTMENSTISGNSAVSAGGIFNGGTATITFTTFSDNFAGGFNAGGAINSPAHATLNLGSSIVANSTAGHDCGSGAFSTTEITSLGYNLIEDVSSTCSIVGDTTGNIIGSDPMLGPLAFNGGSTETHAVLAGSPVIDAGDPACPPPGTDQRTVPRPQGPLCEMGSWENPEGVALVQVDNTAFLTITGRVATAGDIFCGPSGDTFRIFVRANQTSTGAITRIGQDSGPCSTGADRWGVVLRRTSTSPAFQPGPVRICYQARTYTGTTETDRLTACDTDVMLTD